jgi:lantibiotic transport system permease protein
MKAWIFAIRAELLKLKRTLALGVAIAAPLLVVGLNFLVMLKGKSPAQPPPDPWIASMRIVMELWGIFMLPLLIALQSALVNQQDHQQGLLRVFFSLPVPRTRLFLARLLVVLALMLLSNLMLCLACVGSGYLLALLKPALGFGAAALPLFKMMRLAFTPMAAALFLLALLYWLSHRVPGVALALGIGICGTVGSESRRAGSPIYFELRPHRLSARNLVGLLGSSSARGELGSSRAFESASLNRYHETKSPSVESL